MLSDIECRSLEKNVICHKNILLTWLVYIEHISV